MAAFVSSLQDSREPSSFPGSEHKDFVQLTKYSAVFRIAGTGLVNYKAPLIPFVTLFSGHRVVQLCMVVM